MAIRKRRLRSVKLTDSVVVDCDQPYVDVIPYALSGEQKEIAMIVVDGVSSIISAPSGGEISSVEIDPKYDFGMCLAEISVNTVSARIMAPVDEVLSGGSNLVNSHAITNALSGLSSECALTGNFSEDFDIGPDGKIYLYKQIAIDSFTIDPSTSRENGNTLEELTLKWAINKSAKSITINSEVINPTTTQKTIVLDPPMSTGSKSFAMTVVDQRDVSVSKSTVLTFMNKHYWGSVENKDIIADGKLNTAFLAKLSNELNNGVKSSFTTTATEGKYIFYVLPHRDKLLTFKVNGFDGGFDRIVQNVLHVNAYGYECMYDVYKSVNSNLGTTTVYVSA